MLLVRWHTPFRRKFIHYSGYVQPRLSTVAQPLEDMGVAAADQLVTKIQKPQETHAARVFFPDDLADTRIERAGADGSTLKRAG